MTMTQQVIPHTFSVNTPNFLQHLKIDLCLAKKVKARGHKIKVKEGVGGIRPFLFHLFLFKFK